jgi:hypothetical protein
MERFSEDTKAVLLTVDDYKNVESFMNFFEIPINQTLREILDDIYKGETTTFEQQKNFRIYFAECVLESKHPLFQDPAFNEICESMKTIVDEMRFEKELKNILK